MRSSLAPSHARFRRQLAGLSQFKNVRRSLMDRLKACLPVPPPRPTHSAVLCARMSRKRCGCGTQGRRKRWSSSAAGRPVAQRRCEPRWPWAPIGALCRATNRHKGGAAWPGRSHAAVFLSSISPSSRTDIALVTQPCGGLWLAKLPRQQEPDVYSTPELTSCHCTAADLVKMVLLLT